MIKLSAAVLAILLVLASFAPADDLPARYHTYQQILDTLTDLRASHSDILYLDTLGYSSRDSIPILRLKISDNAVVDEDEPAVFFDGGVHADEVLGVEVVLNFVQDIVAKYDRGDPDVISYINSLEIFVVPMINPEGHLVVEGGGTAWRKNKADNDNNGIFDFHDGVDNNRNYDFGWDIDDTPDALAPESLEFKGYAPFTESENVAMAAFGWKYRPLIAIDHHSPTYGRPNVSYYPWYWYSSEGGHGYSPDESLMQSICQAYASHILAIPDDSNTVTYTARRALVDKGDFKTYYYGNFGTAAFVTEISDTTIQDVALVDSIVTAHLPGLYYLLGRALGPGITGVIRDSVTLEPLEAEVQVLQHINDDLNPRLSRPDFGRYNRLLAAGTYTLRFIKDGYQTKTINNVVVGSSSPTTTNVLLAPLNPVPPAPELVSPADNAVLGSEQVVFAWDASSTAAGYVIEIAEDQLFENIFEYDSTVTSLNYQNGTPFLSGDYYWRVTAYNGNGYSANSEIRHLQIELSPVPSVPVLTYPVDTTVAAVYIPFDWEEAAGADGYVFELAYDEQFTSMIEYDSSLAVSEYQNATAIVDGTYYWRVSAYNGYGFSNPSAPATFAVELNLGVPMPVSPGDGYYATSPYINFDWLDATDSTGYVVANAYLIEISPNINFESLTEFDSTVTISEYVNSDSLANGDYFWRVKARFGSFWGGYCQPWEFYIDVDTSGVEFLPGDANGDGRLIGSDVTFLVNYFRGGAAPPFEVEGFYPAADANGDCRNIGSDVTYLVNYFRGGNSPVDGNCFR